MQELFQMEVKRQAMLNAICMGNANTAQLELISQQNRGQEQLVFGQNSQGQQGNNFIQGDGFKGQGQQIGGLLGQTGGLLGQVGGLMSQGQQVSGLLGQTGGLPPSPP
jgi:hypothetical protein